MKILTPLRLSTALVFAAVLIALQATWLMPANAESPGCTDPLAANYDPAATIDDGSCQYEGCTDSLALNYDPIATIDDSSCVYDEEGCTDPTALNFDPAAVIDDGSCVYEEEGCTDAASMNYDPSAVIDDGSCTYGDGCTDPGASNYDPSAVYEDFSCEYEEMCMEEGSLPVDEELFPVSFTGPILPPRPVVDAITDVIVSGVQAIERWRDLNKACIDTYEEYKTTMPGVTRREFVGRCTHYAMMCTNYANANATASPYTYKDAARHRCIMAGLGCEFGPEVALKWGFNFEKHGGDCDFEDNYESCQQYFMDPADWEEGDACADENLADSCRDTKHNQTATACLQTKCNEYEQTGELDVEWWPMLHNPKICCELTNGAGTPPTRPSGTCDKPYCEMLAKEMADDERDVYHLYKVDEPPACYVIDILPASQNNGAFCS